MMLSYCVSDFEMVPVAPIITGLLLLLLLLLPIAVATLPKAWVCGFSLAGTAGSNSTGGMDVCLL